MSLIREFARDEGGAVAVEASIALPVAAILILGTVEFGNVFYTHQLLTQSVRDAGRYLARTNDPYNNTTAKNMVIRGGPDTGSPYMAWLETGVTVTTVQSSVDNPIDSVTGASPYRGEATINILIVNADVTYTPIFGMLKSLGLGDTVKFRISHAERVIGE
jgi:Flp pilus assembly pilin Flp